MIEAAVLLAVLGTADLVRAPAESRATSAVLGVVAGLIVAIGAVPLLGIEPWAAIAAGVLLALWLWAMTPRWGASPHRIWPAIVVLIAVGVAAVTLPVAAPSDAVAGWYGATGPGAAGIGWTTAVVTIGVLLFLLRSTNLVVRAALNSRAAARGSGAPDAAPRPSLPSGSEGWRVRIGQRAVADVERVPASRRRAPQLVGGRVIGPIERLLLVGLGLAGAAAVIAALVAAKGVVRFPEISADRGTGSNAETFLVGSLTSWAVAAGGALLIWATLQL